MEDDWMARRWRRRAWWEIRLSLRPGKDISWGDSWGIPAFEGILRFLLPVQLHSLSVLKLHLDGMWLAGHVQDEAQPASQPDAGPSQVGLPATTCGYTGHKKTKKKKRDSRRKAKNKWTAMKMSEKEVPRREQGHPSLVSSLTALNI